MVRALCQCVERIFCCVSRQHIIECLRLHCSWQAADRSQSLFQKPCDGPALVALPTVCQCQRKQCCIDEAARQHGKGCSSSAHCPGRYLTCAAAVALRAGCVR